MKNNINKHIKTIFIILITVIFLVQISFASSNDDELLVDGFNLFMNHGTIMLILNPENGDILYANYAAEKFYKYTMEELVTMNIKDINILTNEEVQKELELANDQKRNYFRFQHVIKDGSIKDVEVYSYPIEIRGTEVLFSILFDTTIKEEAFKKNIIKDERLKSNMILSQYLLLIIILLFILFFQRILKSNKRLKYLTEYDSLTGLLNRTTIRNEYIKLISENKLPFALFMIDMDNLKFINDAFGHLEGDKIIRMAAEMLMDVTPSYSKVARVSGDEFVCIVPGCKKSEQNKILVNIRNKELIVRGITFRVSIGSINIESLDVTYDSAFSTAEKVMYTNKASNKLTSNIRIEKELMNLLRDKNAKLNNYSQFIFETVSIIGDSLNLDKRDIVQLIDAAKLQNIGLALLHKNYQENSDILTKEEYEVFKKHPEKSYSILNSLGKDFSISNAVFYHHEHYDGSGYPKGLVGNEIPLSSKILRIVDSLYELIYLTNNYEVKIEDALFEIKKHKNTIFDPNLIDLITKPAIVDKLRELDKLLI